MAFQHTIVIDFVVSFFVDFAKAFDVIDHSLLVRKLTLYGLPTVTLTLLTYFLTNRANRVRERSYIQC